MTIAAQTQIAPGGQSAQTRRNWESEAVGAGGKSGLQAVVAPNLAASGEAAASFRSSWQALFGGRNGPEADDAAETGAGRKETGVGSSQEEPVAGARSSANDRKGRSQELPALIRAALPSAKFPVSRPAETALCTSPGPAIVSIHTAQGDRTSQGAFVARLKLAGKDIKISDDGSNQPDASMNSPARPIASGPMDSGYIAPGAIAAKHIPEPSGPRKEAVQQALSNAPESSALSPFSCLEDLPSSIGSPTGREAVKSTFTAVSPAQIVSPGDDTVTHSVRSLRPSAGAIGPGASAEASAGDIAGTALTESLSAQESAPPGESAARPGSGPAMPAGNEPPCVAPSIFPNPAEAQKVRVKTPAVAGGAIAVPLRNKPAAHTGLATSISLPQPASSPSSAGADVVNGPQTPQTGPSEGGAAGQAISIRPATPAMDLSVTHSGPVVEHRASSPNPIGARSTGLRETFAALDGPSPAGNPTWTHATPRQAEAGFQDPTLGWIGVRADISGGEVHASLVPGSTQAAEELGKQMDGIKSHLAEQHTSVDSLVMDAPIGITAEVHARAGLGPAPHLEMDQGSSQDLGGGTSQSSEHNRQQQSGPWNEAGSEQPGAGQAGGSQNNSGSNEGRGGWPEQAGVNRSSPGEPSAPLTVNGDDAYGSTSWRGGEHISLVA